jgi:hypothetical protein
MSRTRGAVLLIIAALAVTSAGLAACRKDAPSQITSPWPVATMERVVPKPAEPPRWPYTGKKAPSAAAIRRRPLSVKIENSPAARPQTGLGKADVVYETIAEGGITRFNAIFHSTVPPVAGPVRSARLSDLWIVPQYDGIFIFSGGSFRVNRGVRSAGLPNLSEDAGISFPYFRSAQRPRPHNLYVDTAKAYQEAKRRGVKVTANLQPLQHLRRRPAETSTVTRIDIPFSDQSSVRWVYDKKLKQYRRWDNGAVHEAEETGKQLTADNVVVMWAKYEAEGMDKIGSTTYDVILGGKGRVSVFHNGARLDGTWTAGRDAPPRFKDKDGRPIRLAPGRTWFQVIPLNGAITMK